MRHSTRSLTSAAAVAALALGGVLVAAAPAQAATCTTTPTTWADLYAAFAGAPATGAVICLGADITHPGTSQATDALAAPYGTALIFDLNGHSLNFSVVNGANNPADVAGIDASNGTTLTIDATGGGSLSVSTTNSGGAAIGGAANQAFGNVIINGGTITASTSYDGAGIGSGQYTSPAGGSVTINGGTVTATTYNCGAGIGAGAYSDATPPITINGGTVTATGSCGGAGIGGADAQGGGSILITGGIVVGTGANQGAGIGGGGNGGSVVISGGDVTATSVVGGGAGIGADWSGQGTAGTLTLVGAGIPTPTSGNNGVAVSATGTTQAGAPQVAFLQTTTDGSATVGPRTHIVFGLSPLITTATLPAGTIGEPYSETVSATGTGPVTFALATGDVLPEGLTLDPATGVVSGTPIAAGTSTFSITATNAFGTDTTAYTVTIPVPVTPSPTPTPTPTPTAAAVVPASGPSNLASTGMNTPELVAAVGLPAAVVVAVGAILLYRRRTQH